MNFDFLLPKARKLLIKNTESRYQHFTFLLKKNKVVCVGWNQKTTHPVAEAYGYERSIHSEVHCILKAQHFINISDLRKYILVNILLRKKRIKISKPCALCQNFLQDFTPKAIYFSLEGGGWRRFN